MAPDLKKKKMLPVFPGKGRKARYVRLGLIKGTRSVRLGFSKYLRATFRTCKLQCEMLHSSPLKRKCVCVGLLLLSSRGLDPHRLWNPRCKISACAHLSVRMRVVGGKKNRANRFLRLGVCRQRYRAPMRCDCDPGMQSRMHVALDLRK